VLLSQKHKGERRENNKSKKRKGDAIPGKRGQNYQGNKKWGRPWGKKNAGGPWMTGGGKRGKSQQKKGRTCEKKPV